MKRNMKLLGLLAIAIFIVLQSCKKEEDFNDLGQTQNLTHEDSSLYDEFGSKLETVVDRALSSEDFKSALIELTQERRMGDFEVLFTSLLDYTTENGESIKNLLLAQANGAFDESQLDAFLENYPSLIIATRGNIISWVKNEHSPPTVFVPSSFQESDLEIEGKKSGKSVPIKLDTHSFDDAVIVMHISERHDSDGNPIIVDHTPPNTTVNSSLKPSVNMNDEIGAGTRSSCAPEPVSCTAPEILAFDVEEVNGGVKISYDIDNFPESLCTWGRITITRIGPAQPNGEVEVVQYLRYANDFHIFYDVNINTNTEYIYTIEAKTTYIDPNGPQTPNHDLIVCNGNSMEETITSGGILPLLNTFRGRNQNNSTLLYNWIPPQGANWIRLRRLTESQGYQEIPGSPYSASSGDNYEQYIHPIGDRGNLVEMQAQYKESAGWGGDYFDRSYASFRNPGQPLYYYGSRIPDQEAYELSSSGEGPLFGAPEIRLLAVQGAGTLDDRNTIIVQQTVIFMSNCIETVTIGPFQFNVATDYFIPSTGVPIDILAEWDPNLEGSAITVKLTETDIAEINITSQSNTSTTTIGIQAKFGYKAGIDLFGLITANIEASIGVEASWKNAEEIEIMYPTSDIEMDLYTMYYHNKFALPHNSHLYGLVTDDDGGPVCDILPLFLEGRN